MLDEELMAYAFSDVEESAYLHPADELTYFGMSGSGLHGIRRGPVVQYDDDLLGVPWFLHVELFKRPVHEESVLVRHH